MSFLKRAWSLCYGKAEVPKISELSPEDRATVFAAAAWLLDPTERTTFSNHTCRVGRAVQIAYISSNAGVYVTDTIYNYMVFKAEGSNIEIEADDVALQMLLDIIWPQMQEKLAKLDLYSPRAWLLGAPYNNPALLEALAPPDPPVAAEALAEKPADASKPPVDAKPDATKPPAGNTNLDWMKPASS